MRHSQYFFGRRRLLNLNLLRRGRDQLATNFIASSVEDLWPWKECTRMAPLADSKRYGEKKLGKEGPFKLQMEDRSEN
jgi:hypothetical protein